jgi:multidrug efflux pump subunit AcrA (membrane-fusion protein)
MGAGRAPLIIAGVAALIAYAVFGEQTPFGFLHRLGGHHHAISISTDKSDDIAQTARDAADAARDKAEEARERAEELRQAAVDKAQAEVDKAQAIADSAQAAVDNKRASGNETRVLDPFDSVTIENNADATITIGDTQSVMITGDIGHTDTRVHDGKLIVSGSIPGVRVAIIVPHLRALEVNGFGKVSLVGLRDPIAIKANGAVQLWGSGTVDSAELTLNGPSKFALSKLETKNLVVQVNGVGDADVYATENLVADVKGVGHVSYRGSPHLVTKINGPGSVQRVASSEG